MILRPTHFGRRLVFIFEIHNRRMSRIDTAVDHGDDDILASQLKVGTQSAGLVQQAEKQRAVVGCQAVIAVTPDTGHFRVSRKTGHFRRCEYGRKTVECVSKAIQLFAAADIVKDGVVFLGKKIDVAVDVGS